MQYCRGVTFREARKNDKKNPQKQSGLVFFQHIKYVTRQQKALCNLRNEVFVVTETRINTKDSLTVCEGISRTKMDAAISQEFPHFM